MVAQMASTAFGAAADLGFAAAMAFAAREALGSAGRAVLYGDFLWAPNWASGLALASSWGSEVWATV